MFQEFKYLLLILTIFIGACIETDIFLPALPDMIQYFSVSEDQIQQLLSWNFVGICLACPFYGPISDAVGRKKPLLFALGLFFLGSLLTVCSYDFNTMLWGRVLQGFGSGGCFTLGTAIVFDAFQKERAIIAINRLNTLCPFIMAMAPLAGGFLNLHFGFRSNFLAICFVVLFSITLCVLCFTETLAPEKRSPLRLTKVLTDFKRVLTSIPFWQLLLVVSFGFCGYLVFLASTAVIFVIEWEVSKQLFPLFQAALLGAWLAASLTSTRVRHHFGVIRVKAIGTSMVTLGGLAMGLLWFIAPTNPYLMTASMMIYAIGFNWVQGLYFPEMMELLPDIKGVAASVLTSMRLLLAATSIALTASFYDGTMFPVVCAIVAITMGIVGLILAFERGRKESTIVQNAEVHSF